MRSHDLIEYLSMVINQGGSDLHLSVGAPPTGRIYGQLQPLTEDVLMPMTSATSSLEP